MRKYFLLPFCGALLLAISTYSHAVTWKESSWGRGWVTLGPVTAEGDDNNSLTRQIRGQIDDIREDGYCVYLRYRITGQSWPAYSAREWIKSCGPITSFDWSPTFPNGKNVGGIRLYRDNGNYMTLWGS